MILVNKNLAGKQTILPIVGLVELDEEGKIEIEDESLCESLLSMSDWNKEVKETKAKKVKVKVDEDDEENEDEDDEEKVAFELLNKLNDMSLAQLVELATESGLPITEWEKFSKNEKKPEMLMVSYLKKKLK